MYAHRVLDHPRPFMILVPSGTHHHADLSSIPGRINRHQSPSLLLVREVGIEHDENRFSPRVQASFFTTINSLLFRLASGKNDGSLTSKLILSSLAGSWIYHAAVGKRLLLAI